MTKIQLERAIFVAIQGFVNEYDTLLEGVEWSGVDVFEETCNRTLKNLGSYIDMFWDFKLRDEFDCVREAIAAFSTASLQAMLSVRGTSEQRGRLYSEMERRRQEELRERTDKARGWWLRVGSAEADVDIDDLGEISSNETAPTAVRDYARAKRRAILARADGRIAVARREERTCDAIYNQIPPSFRW